MRITDVRLEEREGSFCLHGSSDAFANALRTAMMRDVPVPAVTKGRVLKNTSPLPDDYIVHRAGLVPLRRKEGASEGSLTLRAEGEGKVYAGEMVGEEFCVEEEECLLAVLPKGGELHMELTVETQTGKLHARHNASVAARYVRRTIGGPERECFCESTGWGERCPLCGCEKRSIHLASAPCAHFFRFETTGSLTARELLQQALASIRARVEAVRQAMLSFSSCKQ